MQRKRTRKHRNRTLQIGLMAVLLSAAYSTSHTGWAASGSTAAAASEAGAALNQAGTRLADDESSSHHHHTSQHRHVHEEGHKQSASVQWSFSPKQPQAGEHTTIQLAVVGVDGRPVQSFALNHEKEIHLIAVSSDLSEFQHLHPADEGAGHFAVDTVFPTSGTYKLFADFIPSGGSHQVAQTEVEAGGKAAAAQPLAPDKQLAQTVAGTRVTLQTGQLKAGQKTSLAFSLKDAQTGKPVSDMEPYLGAAGHVVIISEDLTQYLHVHPKEGQSAGPEASFETELPAPGLYKVWGQFQRHGNTFIASFTIKVGE